MATAGRVRLRGLGRRDSSQRAAAAGCAERSRAAARGRRWLPGAVGTVGVALLLTACSPVGPGPSAGTSAVPSAVGTTPSGSARGSSLAAADGPWVDQPVTFRAAGMTVYATYRHPAAADSAGPASVRPAVVLIPGNGSTDRNGNTPLFQGPINEIKAVADWLSADGVASLRFDRLGSGQTGFGPYTSAADREAIAFSQSATPLEPVEQETAAALRFLAQQRGTDRARLGVIGHSEGALYALLLAAGADPKGSGPLPHVRAIGLLEPFPGHWPGRYAAASLAEGVPAGTPVLVTCSDADIQVSCTDVSSFRAGLARAQAATDFVLLTGVDHVLKQDPSGAFDNYTKPLPYSSQLRQALRSFVQRNL